MTGEGVTYHGYRHAARCDVCGRLMAWARWVSFNCFAGHQTAWCPRPHCAKEATR